MVTNAILRVLGLLLEGLASMFSSMMPPMPDWLVTGIVKTGEVFSFTQGFDAWLPLPLAFTIAGAVVASYALSVVIQTTRTVISYFTFGGGGT